MTLSERRRLQERGIELDYSQAAAYVSSWVSVLEQDKSLVTSAALHAQRASDWILGTTFEEAEMAA